MVRFVSHEIRTPLSTISVGLELLERDLTRSNHIKKTELLETVSAMRTQCDSAIEILSDLLNYEKLDSGLMKLDKTDVHALSLLIDTIKPFRIQV